MHQRLHRRSLFAIGATLPFLRSGRVSATRYQQATPVERAASSLDVASTALLVMDYQGAWLETLTDPDAVLTQTAAAIATAREHEMLVAYAQVTFTSADYAAAPDHNIIFNQIARPPGALDADAPGNDRVTTG